jgi:hypothetical protein
MKSPKLTEEAILSCRDDAHDVIKAAEGRLTKLSERCSERHQSGWKLPCQDVMMLLMTSSKLLEVVVPRCHDSTQNVIKAAGGCLARTT